MLVNHHKLLPKYVQLTNEAKEMDMRLQHYVDSLFVRILRDTGCSYLTFEYFLQVLCLRNEFISALDYIT